MGCGRRRLGGLVEPGGLLRAQSFIRILLLLLWWRGLGLRSCGLRLRFWRRRRRRRRTILRGALVPDALRALLLDDRPPCNRLRRLRDWWCRRPDTSGSARRSSRLGSVPVLAPVPAPPAAASSGTRTPSRWTRGRSPAARARRASRAPPAPVMGVLTLLVSRRGRRRDPSRARRVRDACDPGGAVDAAVERC